MSNQPNILIVDDNKMVRRAVKLMLKKIDALTTEAENGQIALSLIEDNPTFDLIITDIDMPEMDGISLCNHLKINSATSSIPVIILSMFDSENAIIKGFKAGADAYISKKKFQPKLLGAVKENLLKSTIRSKCLIMIVDNSRAVRLSIESFLSEQGFDVITAENGREALVHLENKLPNLILSSFEMPVMDGLSLCRAVKSNPKFRSIPFVVMSIHDEQSIMKRFVHHGASAYLTKPFNFNELAILIEKIVSDHYLLLTNERERIEADRDAMLASIASLADALEARDTYTRGHSESVANIVKGMLTFTGTPEDEIERVVIGAKLHDLGKIGIRDSVLLNPGKLSGDEWHNIRKHPTIGANILETIPSLNDILPIVLHHHERFDGNGYPDGIKGKNIPFWSRLTAVADTFSALTDNRPYRKSMKQEKALEIIHEVSGTQLCPECTKLFFEWFKKRKV